MKKSNLFLLIIFMLTIVLAACTSGSNTNKVNNPSDASGSELVVGFSQMENNMPWRIAETESVRGEGKKRNIKMVYSDAQSDTAKQVSDVEDMIAQGVDYIILAPREFEGLTPALQSAKNAGIPVILVDRKAQGEAGEDYVTFIGSDFIEQGKTAAKWLINAMDGEGGIVELTGTAGASVALDRQKGFTDYIEENAPDMQVLASQVGDFTRAEGQKVMENLLQSQGDKIKAVYAHNDEMAIGAVNAIEAAGKKPGEDIIIVSIDGTKDAFDLILDGKIGATVESSPFLGPYAFDVIEQLENGEDVPTEIIIEDSFFDISNAEEFIDQAY